IQGFSGLATKDQLMTFLRWHDPNSVHGPAKISDQAIRFYNNDAAIWTGRYDEDLHVNGAATHKTDFFTMVWADRNDKWQIVHLQVLPEESPTTKPADSHERAEMLQTLKKTLDQAIRDRDAIWAQMEEFKRLNPNLQLDDIFMSQLQTISAELTQSQLMLINTKAMYQANHPILQNAQRREQVLEDTYRQQLKLVMDVNAKRAEYQKLQAEFDQKQAFINVLQKHIDVIEHPQAP
ncbi:MAG TPA: DUF4440 domain-containing protein, partial [Tepidisphaeraceae bacterium]